MPTDDKKVQPRIAVIDDEPTVCREIKRGLQKAGYRVETFSEGESAIRRLSQIPFDLVLCDLVLRDCSGIDVLKTIKNRCPLTEVIIITGYGSVPSAVEAMKLGVSEYIQKPFTPEQITKAVSTALGTAKEPGRPSIEADLVRKVLKLASSDKKFGQRLLYEGSRVLCGFALSPEAKAAIVSGPSSSIVSSISLTHARSHAGYSWSNSHW